MRTFIKEKISNGFKGNFTILVPIKALLISEFTTTLIDDLKDDLNLNNYTIINSAGTLALRGKHT